MSEVMGELGFDLSPHRSQTLTCELVGAADLVVTMERRHVHDLAEMCGPRRIFTLPDAIAALAREPVETSPPFEIDTKLEMGVVSPLKFDLTEFKVKTGAGVALTFNNNDKMPMIHNLVLVKPGARFEVVSAAANMGAKGLVNEFVPKSDKVIAFTPLVLHRNTYTLYFRAPAKPGKYEYVCTYPGHGLTMWGTMVVE